MPTIDLIGITNPICRNIFLKVHDGEFMVLAGSTGAGKTTLLNVIAGLTPYQGNVCFDGVAIDHRPPAKRQVGYLFQEFALFPHLSVGDNIAFGLQARGWDKRAMEDRVHELLDLLGLKPLVKRYPRTLSGGEKQRVALARTLAFQPEVLLLDEPFSNVDPRTAKFLRLELKKLHRQLGLTALYVTHNHKEAFELGDRIAVVDQGRIEQVSRPSDILFDPQTHAVAELFGAPNIFDCRAIQSLDFGLGKADCNGLSLIVPYEGRTVAKIVVLPSCVQVSTDDGGQAAPNRMAGRVAQIFRKAPVVSVEVLVGRQTITAELPELVWDDLRVGVTDRVYVTLPIKWIQVLEG